MSRAELLSIRQAINDLLEQRSTVHMEENTDGARVEQALKDIDRELQSSEHMDLVP